MSRKRVKRRNRIFTRKEKDPHTPCCSYIKKPKKPSQLLFPKDPLLKEFLADMQRRGYAHESQRNRMVHLGRFLAWLTGEGIEHPGQATTRDLERFALWLAKERVFRGRNLSPSTRAEYITALRALYLYMKQEGMILTDPAENLGLPKVPRRIHRDILSVDEMWQLLDEPDRRTPSGLRDHVAMRLLAFTGLRIRELVRLNTAEVDLEAREIMVRQGKGRKDRLVFFDTKTRVRLAEYLVCSRPALIKHEEIRALVLNDSGYAISSESVRDLIANHTKSAGIGKHLTCHSLRRTFCTLLLQAGCNLKVMSNLAGHVRLSTTARYTRIHSEEVAAAYRDTHPRSQA